jgi:hypothetical protein
VKLRMKFLPVFLLVLSVAGSAFVCTPSQQNDAAKFADAYAQSLKAVHDTVDTQLVTGKITPAEKVAVLTVLLRANEAGLHLNAAIRAVAAAPGSNAAVQAALAEANAALNDGTLSVKNPDSAAAIAVIIAAAKATLQQVAILYGGA